MEIEPALTDQELDDWFKQFLDPYQWRPENYDTFVHFACGCVYPAPKNRVWACLCPVHQAGVVARGPYRLREG